MNEDSSSGRVARLMKRVRIDGTCWIWTGVIKRNGYGQTSDRRLDGKWATAYVHRIMFILMRGPIPLGMELDHLFAIAHVAIQIISPPLREGKT
jgi:hypothetical protein